MEEPRLTDGRLKIRHLALADALSTHGTLVRAAGALRVSQPALSRTLRELESIVGVELFERGPRGAVPTVYGAAFTEYARRILASLTQAGRHIAELADARQGTVTVGVEAFGGQALTSAATIRMKADHPRVTVVVLEADVDQLLDDVEAGRLDCAVGFLPDLRQRRELSLQRHFSEATAFAVRRGHPLLRRAAPTLPELMHLPWVLPTSSSPLRSQFDLVLGEAELDHAGNRVEAGSPGAMASLIAASDSVGFLPRATVDESPRLRALDPELDLPALPVGVVTSTDRQAGPAARAMLRALADEARALRAAAARP